MADYSFRYNPVGIDIPLPDGKTYNTEYPKYVNGAWVNSAEEEIFYSGRH